MSESLCYSPEAISTLMHEAGLDLKGTAKAAGVSTAGLEAYLLGKRKTPSVSCLMKLADFFGVPLDYICGRMSSEDVCRVKDGCAEHFRAMRREAYEMYLCAGKKAITFDAPPIAPWPYNLIEEVLHEETGDTITQDRMAGLDKALFMLDERSADVVVKLYRDGATLAEIGDRYGVTKERVRQIAAKSIRQLRHKSRRKYIEYGLEAAEEADNLGKRKLALIRERMEIAEEERALNERRLHLAALREELDKEESLVRKTTGDEVLDIGASIDLLYLSVRAHNCLMRSHLTTIGAVAKAAKNGELQKIPYLGKKTVNEIRAQILERAGLDIGENWG